MTTSPPAGRRASPRTDRASRSAGGRRTRSPSSGSSIELLGLVTTAQTWEELLETVVDGTRDALGASVSSLYLLDRDGTRLTLAATNGLDRFQIGRAVVPFGEGITGRVAATREAMVIPDVAAEPRFLWVRGIDQRRFVASMLSVPLEWHDQVVGVLNVQTEEHREFTPSDVDQLSAIADLLAGIVEKGRLQREAEAQVEQLKALDQARNELIALVTHELRTPLAVVRAYTDLLADEPVLEGRSSRDPVRRAQRASWHRGTVDQIERLDRLVDSILESVRVVPDRPPDLQTIDLAPMIDEVLGDLGPLLARHRQRITGSRRLHVMADRTACARCSSTCSRTPSSTRRRTRRSSSTGGWTRASCGSRSPTTGRASRPSGATGSSNPMRATRRPRHAARASACTPLAGWPSRWAGGCGVSRRRPAARASCSRCPRPSRSERNKEGLLIGTRPLRILVVDDDPAMVGAITALVGTEGHQVITAYDGLTAVKRFREERPDLVLLDLAMPGPDGFTVIGQLRATGNVPVLVVSGESAEAAKVKALGIGADDYLVKPFGKQELLARISAVMRRVDLAGTGRVGGNGDGPAGVLTAGSLTLEPARHEARVGAIQLNLTPTEFRLLEALVRAGGDLVAHHRLARAGWPAEPDPDLLWLKPHLARLRSKLEAVGGPRIVAVRSVGYRIEADEPA